MIVLSFYKNRYKFREITFVAFLRHTSRATLHGGEDEEPATKPTNNTPSKTSFWE